MKKILQLRPRHHSRKSDKFQNNKGSHENSRRGVTCDAVCFVEAFAKSELRAYKQYGIRSPVLDRICHKTREKYSAGMMVLPPSRVALCWSRRSGPRRSFPREWHSVCLSHGRSWSYIPESVNKKTEEWNERLGANARMKLLYYCILLPWLQRIAVHC